MMAPAERPLAARIALTEVAYFRAMPKTVSPATTVWLFVAAGVGVGDGAGAPAAARSCRLCPG